MKKLLCILTTVVLLFSLTLCVSAAETGDNLLFGVSNKAVDNGYEITVRVSSDYACSGIQGSFTFSDKLTYLSASFPNEAIAAKNTIEKSVSVADNEIKFSVLGDVKDGAECKWVEFKFTSDTMVYNNEITLGSQIKGVKATSYAQGSNLTFTYGDLNDDDSIDMLDLINFKNYELHTSTIAITDEAANFIGDNNTVDSADMLALRKFLFANF